MSPSLSSAGKNIDCCPWNVILYLLKPPLNDQTHNRNWSSKEGEYFLETYLHWTVKNRVWGSLRGMVCCELGFYHGFICVRCTSHTLVCGHFICSVITNLPMSRRKGIKLFRWSQVDHIYIQSLRGIRELHETGINETNFHEVQMW